MEAPTPPPGLSYNGFRTWRKARGISSTHESLSAAWKEYSAPMYAAIIASHPRLPPAAVVPTTTTREWPRERVITLIRSRVNLRELLGSLSNLTLPFSLRIPAFVPHVRPTTTTPGQNTHTRPVETLAPIEETTLIISSSQDVDNATERIREIVRMGGPRAYSLKVELSPPALIQVLSRRISRVTQDPEHTTRIRDKAKHTLVDSVKTLLLRELSLRRDVTRIGELLTSNEPFALDGIPHTRVGQSSRGLQVEVQRMVGRLVAEVDWLTSTTLTTPTLESTALDDFNAYVKDHVIRRLRALYQRL